VTVLARRSSLLLLSAVACCAIALAVGAQQASAAYTKCSGVANHSIGKYGTGLYLKTLKVKGGPTCAGAKNFVKLYYQCRTKGDKPLSGRCYSKVSGYTCGTEVRTNKTSTAFDGRVTCHKGDRYVRQTYIQRTA